MAYQCVRSVVHAMAILESLREKTFRGEYITLAEAAEAAGVSRVSAFHLLKTLEGCGYVRHSARGRYEEGERGAVLIAGSGLVARLTAAARPLMERAAESGKESFVLVTLHNAHRVELLRIGKIKNSHSARFEANADIYGMRTTRAILAWCSRPRLEYFVKHNGLPSAEVWPEVNESFPGLIRELGRIRENGGCCDLHGNLTATAVPVFSDGNEVVASLGCYSPRETTDFFRQQGIYKILHDYALSIEKEISNPRERM